MSQWKVIGGPERFTALGPLAKLGPPPHTSAWPFHLQVNERGSLKGLFLDNKTLKFFFPRGTSLGFSGMKGHLTRMTRTVWFLNTT